MKAFRSALIGRTDGHGGSSAVGDGNPSRCRHLSHLFSGCPLGSAVLPSHRRLLQFSSLSQRGHYPDSPDSENQDALSIKTPLQGNPDVHLFAVFDGHKQFGAQCAAFARDRLYEHLEGDTHLRNDPVKSFHSAFLVVNSELHDSEIDERHHGDRRSCWGGGTRSLSRTLVIQASVRPIRAEWMDGERAGGYEGHNGHYTIFFF